MRPTKALSLASSIAGCADIAFVASLCVVRLFAPTNYRPVNVPAQPKRPSFDDLVGDRQQGLRKGDIEFSRGLKVENELVFGGCLRRQLGRTFPTQHAIDIVRGLVEGSERIGTIGHQAAVDRELPVGVNRGQSETLDQPDDRDAVRGVERIGRDDDTCARVGGKCRQRGFHFSHVARRREFDHGAEPRLSFEKPEVEIGGAWIEQQGCLRDAWGDLLQELEPLSNQRRLKKDKTGQVAARTRHSLDIAQPDRVGGQIEYDRNGAGCLIQFAGHRRAVANDDIGSRGDELGNDLANSRDAAAGPPGFKLGGVAINPAALFQSGNERGITPDTLGIALSHAHQYRDPAGTARLLRLRYRWPTNGEDRRAAGGSDELAPSHSTTPSARARIALGNLMPSVAAVF